ncbi:Hypothetical protein AJAP_38410 [Amycolatopsis japonica]|uniref:Uncharacterized protein n=1 Tax=Amycolatopsis japonica TaxID=208439 RepID=A0A075V5B6_9PSEU|nr:hypothetical protein [Amycolatopsis japonica]AIG80468.1 Hypothetical protein AJAP_38410 [Amycolatopsis japonica]
MAADLETLIAQVWSPEVRPLAEEALRCYNAGAVRSSIIASWAAVTADIIVKVTRLADEGDTQVKSFWERIVEAQQQGLNRAGVQLMQRIEADLVDKAVEFELIDTIGQRELDRIREDRHLCAHPSLRAEGEVYIPRPEMARGHLAVALTTLLIHPPTQGRKLVEKFKDHVCDPLFTPSIPYLQATFHDRVREATRKAIITVAAKAAMLELDPGGRMSAAAHADRMAITLLAFAGCARQTVSNAVVQTRDRFQLASGDVQLRTLVRMADQDYFWDTVDPGMASKLEAMINSPITVGEYEPLPAEIATSAALVGSKYARDRMPTLLARFDGLSMQQRISVMEARPSGYFVPTITELLASIRGFRFAEQIGRLAVQHAQFLESETLRSVLAAWFDNYQCRRASDMPHLAVQLFHATAHLGPARGNDFVEFLAKCKRDAETDNDHYYSYPALETTLRTAGVITSS